MTATSPAVAAEPGRHGDGRMSSLDGLRGAAALIVVVHHALLLVPAFSAAYEWPRGHIAGLAWLLTYTPLHLLWDGPAAVSVFFVLSGLVLTRASRQLGTLRSWMSWYPSRLLRLYIPTTVAVLASAALWFAVPRVDRPGLSWWLGVHDERLTWSRLVTDLVLVNGTTTLNTALWSLRWEVMFSLALPLFLLLGRGRAPLVLAQVTGLLAVMVLQGGSHLSLRYLPMFGLGVILARQLSPLAQLGTRLSRSAWCAVCALAVLVLEARWLIGPNPPARAVMLDYAVTSCGAVLLVWAFATWPPLVRVAGRPVARWLGAVSFSLYLVHEPVVVSVGFLWTGRLPTPLVVLIAVILGLLAGWGFHRAFEAPAHALARRVARLGRVKPNDLPRAGSAREATTHHVTDPEYS